MKNKQASNKSVPHKSTKVAEKITKENEALHATFYAVHVPSLYEKGSGYTATRGGKASQGVVAAASVQFNSTARHASKVISGRGTPQCLDGCKCPNAVKAAATRAAETTPAVPV